MTNPTAAQPLDLDKQRALFEAVERDSSSNLKRQADGQYENPCTQSAWEGWQNALITQARAARQAQQAGAAALIPQGAARSSDGTTYHGIAEIYHRFEEGEALHQWLDDKQVPRADADNDGAVFSLVGRVQKFAATSATATTGASTDTPEFRALLDEFAYRASERRAMGGDFGSADAEGKAEAALTAHIDAIIGDLRAQLAANGQGKPECGMCNDSGIVGFPPDQYEECPDCIKARATAPASAQPADAAHAADLPKKPETWKYRTQFTWDEVQAVARRYAAVSSCACAAAPAGHVVDNDKGESIINVSLPIGTPVFTSAVAPSDAKVNADLLDALQKAAKLLRVAGFCMTGTATSQIVAAINAHSDAAGKADAANAGRKISLYGYVNFETLDYVVGFVNDEVPDGYYPITVATSAADAKDAEIGFYKRLSQQAQADAMRERVRDVVAETLEGLYTCGRVWSAWSYGTMSQDDFAPAGEDDDVVDNITDAALAAIAATQHGAKNAERNDD